MTDIVEQFNQASTDAHTHWGYGLTQIGEVTMSNSGGPYFFTTPHLEAQTKVPSDREERRLDLIAQLCGDRGAYMQKHDPNYGYVPGGWFQVRNYGEPHNSLARARAIKYLNMDPKVLTITALRKMIKEKEFTARDEAIYYNLTGRIYTD